jgi:hypothetical protein
MGNIIPIKNWDILGVLKDKNNIPIEIAVDTHSGTLRFSGKDFIMEFSPARAMYIAKAILKYVPKFSKDKILKMYEW